MINALGNPQHVLLLGGTSDIALAIARRYAGLAPGLRVTLAARPGERRDAAVTELTAAGCVVEAVDFDAVDTAAHRAIVESIEDDIDIAVVAFGLLGDPEQAWTDVDAARELAEVNYVGAVTAGVALGARIRTQGHGVIVALSSVAGERPRRSNFVYGSTKAGMDAFYTGLGEALRELGGHVLVVRPGFVHSKMTTGLEAAPLATTPEGVAEAVVEAVRDGKEQIWVPGTMRVVMSGLRHLPRTVFRRLPI
ncbi:MULTISPECIES: decaprenylphospho-beta-D-erythro-pentofuranosid-2-ulose 2-reductase [Aeromicrobium]|uniref:Decaprenylphospho-beta-D-erythro-pentofuranosid-2-ulose 2-reductase n=1 Tax=Aeromicrobium yanjiei TaxID=2662028 RepID=A0A5Q2MLB6_9ACTN|nr:MULTISPECIES: decaprenylphospho-beta-D-erythro-pentofuranosid-2-ulose 2-reductase [Aeromicrobium]MRK02107.1 decaprenylphospho-beta-D-erythro-pentofuranosid-2-ulose 2-reductase [Aeromicrobium sp. S22]QGG41165.1 decaprenylphospho-beta-D-erythro-pentofuranosid-2-ulose 2-reductase [Aeromicrobium yanjiei]